MDTDEQLLRQLLQENEPPTAADPPHETQRLPPERAAQPQRTKVSQDGLRSPRRWARVLLDPRRLNVALSRAKQKLILVASRTVFTQFSTDEQTFANTQIWKNLLRRACTTKLWAGDRDGVRVQVWGNTVSSV